MRRELKMGPWQAGEDGAVRSIGRHDDGREVVFCLSRRDAHEMHGQLGEVIGASRETMWRRVAIVAIGALGVVGLTWLGASWWTFVVLGLALGATEAAEARVSP